MSSTVKQNKYEIDMCNGTIMDKLISFSLPLMLSGILQLMFNAVDIIVVGRFSGSQALAAVGSTTALINVFTNLFIGISLGANVLAARFYAAGKDKEMSETVHTAITLALISGIIMAFVGLICAKPALALMDTPDDVIDLSSVYMRIYFLGMPFFYAVQLRRCHTQSGGRYKEAAPFPGYFRNCKYRSKPMLCDHFQAWSCRCGNRNCYLTADILRACAPLSVYVGDKLSA